MRRREFVTLLGGAAAAWPLALHAQQPGRVWRIVIAGGERPVSIEASYYGGLLTGMREVGYVEGEKRPEGSGCYRTAFAVLPKTMIKLFPEP